MKNPFTVKKLQCGHRFHSKCIETIQKCPLCSQQIFTDSEIKLFKHPEKNSLLKKITNYEAVLHRAIELKNDGLVSKLIAERDPGIVLINMMAAGESDVVKTLIASNKINWHHTFNGQTILELALNTRNDEMVNLVLDKFHFHKTFPSAPPIEMNTFSS